MSSCCSGSRNGCSKSTDANQPLNQCCNGAPKCGLSNEELTTRLSWFEHNLVPLVSEIILHPDRSRIELKMRCSEEEVEERRQSLIRLESNCCSFLQFPSSSSLSIFIDGPSSFIPKLHAQLIQLPSPTQ